METMCSSCPDKAPGCHKACARVHKQVELQRLVERERRKEQAVKNFLYDVHTNGRQYERNRHKKESAKGRQPF